LSGPTAEEVKRSAGLKLVAARPPGVPYLDMPEQWDPKSPWHDRRVRLAASYALDRNALNQAETLGMSRPTGGLIPRVLEFARAYEPPPYDPAQAKKLLGEAGYPNGFDAGDLTPFPPFFGLGEDLFQRQARELDRKKREAMLHQIQQIMHDRVLHVPIYELAFLWGVGPRVEEDCVDWIKGFSYSAPYEDLKLKPR